MKLFDNPSSFMARYFWYVALKASDPRSDHVRYHRCANSLNINLKGIIIFDYSFSVKLYENETKMKSLGQF